MNTNIKTAIVAAVCIIVFVGAVFAGNVLRTGKAPEVATFVSPATTTPVSEIATTTNASTVDHATILAFASCISLPKSISKTKETIPVQWSTPVRIPNLSVVRNGPCGEHPYATDDSYDPGYGPVNKDGAYYTVGTVQSGVYAGGDVILAVFGDGSYDSPGYVGMMVDHFIRKGNTLTLIASSSNPMTVFLDPAKVTIDPNTIIPNLAYPQQLTASNTTFSLQDQYRELGAYPQFPLSAVEKGTQLQNFKLAFTDPTYGPVYTDKEGSDSKYGTEDWYVGYSPNPEGFYLQAPDGTFRVYSMDFPSWWNKDTHATAVTWNDGTQNAAEYVGEDRGGCGSTNYASVMTKLTKDDLTPAGKTSTGDTVYELKDPNGYVYKNIYDKWYEQQKPPYADFLKNHPAFFWYDPLGRLIKFQRADYNNGAECGKPVIYLYPSKTTDVSVKIFPQGGMTKSDPAYGDGWNVRATPEGQLTELATGARYPYLFWEGRGGLYQTPDRGFVVAQSDVHTFLLDKLAQLGLNAQESADFREFWEPRMTGAPYYFVTFLGTQQMNQIAPLTITPTPDTLIRVLMDFHPLQKPIEVQGFDIKTPTRHGFTVLEWGGVLQ